MWIIGKNFRELCGLRVRILPSSPGVGGRAVRAPATPPEYGAENLPCRPQRCLTPLPKRLVSGRDAPMARPRTFHGNVPTSTHSWNSIHHTSLRASVSPSSVISAAGLDTDSLVSDTAASVSDTTDNIFPHRILALPEMA